MALELNDNTSFNGNIVAGSTETLTVDARTADVFELLVDDGAGNAPAGYDVKVELYSTAEDAFVRADAATGQTVSSPPVTDSARGQQVRVSITNSSGADATFRISLESFKEI